ncbi:MAG: hypothetical protein ABII18_01905 [bacterium]|nr:hypothetical protein [bacterium]MBU1918773.1 hypothetical protein [bacterium]
MPRGYNLATKMPLEPTGNKTRVRMRSSWIREPSENRNFLHTIKEQIKFHEKRLQELNKILRETEGH